MTTVPRRAAWRGGHLPTVVAAVIVVLARWLAAHERDVIHMTPDEPGQLAIARFLGRGARWNMFDHSTWRPAYGALISPITWVTQDPVALYRGALAVNALLGGVSCVLLAVLARRLTGRSRLVCAALAAIVALAPALLFTTAWVWSEALVQVTFLVFVLAALRYLDAGRTGWGATMVAAAAAGFATHSRLLPLSATAVVLIAVAAARRRTSWARAGGLVVLLGLLLLAVARTSHWIVDRVWEDPAPTNTVGGVLDRLGDPGALAISGVGQLWYQLVASLGLAGIGAIALLRSASRRRSDRRDGEPGAVDARVLLVTVLPLVGLSVVFMSDRWRPDQIVYGRYNDPVVAVVVLVGLATVLVASGRRLLVDGAVVLAALVTSGVVLWLAKDAELQEKGLLRSMVLGVLAFLGRSRLQVMPVTVWAAILTTGLLLVAVAVRRPARTVVLPALAVVLVVVGFVRTRPVVDAAVNSWDGAAPVQDAPLPPGAIVRDRIGSSNSVSKGTQRLRLVLYEFYRPTNAFYRDGHTPDGVWTPYVFAPTDDAGLRESGATLAWRDPQVAIGLWIERQPD